MGRSADAFLREQEVMATDLYSYFPEPCTFKVHGFFMLNGKKYAMASGDIPGMADILRRYFTDPHGRFTYLHSEPDHLVYKYAGEDLANAPYELKVRIFNADKAIY